MATEKVKIIARITARPETASELKAVLLRLIGPTRAEEGCVSYDFFEGQTDTTDFVFVEEWASAAAIDAHMKSQHVKEAFASAKTLLGAPPDIRMYRGVE